MLVLSRKKNEAVVFDLRDLDLESIPKEERIIKLTVVEIRGDKVRQGVEAPRSIPCHRQEVFDAIEAKGGTTQGVAPAQPAH
jgi:carbon storage regulator